MRLDEPEGGWASAQAFFREGLGDKLGKSCALKRYNPYFPVASATFFQSRNTLSTHTAGPLSPSPAAGCLDDVPTSSLTWSFYALFLVRPFFLVLTARCICP